MKNISMPRSASTDIKRRVGVSDSIPEVLGDTAIGSVVGEAIEDMRIEV
jgi:hypothetical protein